MAIGQVLKSQARVEVRLFNMVTDTIREIADYAVIATNSSGKLLKISNSLKIDNLCFII